MITKETYKIKSLDNKLEDPAFKIIKENLDLFVQTNLPKDFKFRDGQKEIILDILEFYCDNPNGLYLLDAPTGSGKSIIAIIVAGVLSYTKKNGYILTSNIVLQDQYEYDFKRFNLKWGSIKGMSNYICNINYENVNSGDCKARNLTAGETRKLECYKYCEYYKNRQAAMDTPISMLNYSYWLIQRNYVAPKITPPPFDGRDFIICDEAHKITEIVQSHFSPEININTFSKLIELRKFINSEVTTKVNINAVELEAVISNIFNEEDNKYLHMYLKELLGYFSIYEEHIKYILEIIASKYKDKKIPKDIIKGVRLCGWLNDLNCKFIDYVNILDTVSIDVMVKNSGVDSIIFNCIDEGYMMKEYFHKQSKFKLLMSATMGNYNNFLSNIRADGTVRYNKMKSDFNFDKSPIYLWTKRKMTWREKEKTLPWIYDKIDTILSHHKNEGGIIHTGSYDITNKIYNNISTEHKKRIRIYKDTSEKKIILEEIENKENNKNLIIMGPSLLEGIDLNDDKSRFQIFIKVPYPHLKDKFVKAKMEMVDGWYTWKTVIGILQGVGRSVRSKDDWAITYFLDGSLSDLISNNRLSFPKEFIDRLKLIKT